jgi:two-component system, OmpR family, phosphate regulon sensor histidine kinase PhoR
MRQLKQIKWLPVLMAITIACITGFQVYWLSKAYEREKRTLDIRTNMMFRETIHRLQASKLKLEKLGMDSLLFASVQEPHQGKRKKPSPGMRMGPHDKMIGLVNVVNERLKDSISGERIVFTQKPVNDTASRRSVMQQRNRLLQFLYDVDSLQEPVSVAEITAAYNNRLEQQNINIPFTVSRIQKLADEERDFNEVTIGFSNPVTYRLDMGNTFMFLAKRILPTTLLSLFMIGFTIVSFSLLYRNLLRQRRLADIKNEFISNITHELKTPIATVSVAIEAMRSFNAGMDPQKSKEYLDISANELQRLSLLVDKVLKLSMFEKKEIDLKYELLDMRELVQEVTSSMRLQFEKYNADVNVITEGDTSFEGDRLHLVSVIFNLMDNALKYSPGKPKIDLKIKGTPNRLYLSVRDGGIGIPAEYKDKIFDKFFRVPTGNLHNAKGYGLGLSYVAHVVNKHKGTIKVDSVEGNGCEFIISLPKHTA